MAELTLLHAASSGAVLYKLDSQQFVSVGNVGCAVVGCAVSGQYQIICYKDSSSTLCRAIISPSSTASYSAAQGPLYASFVADDGITYSLSFRSEEEADQFHLHVGLAHYGSKGKQSDQIVPFDVVPGAGRSVAIGDTLGVQLLGYIVRDNERQLPTVGPVNQLKAQLEDREKKSKSDRDHYKEMLERERQDAHTESERIRAEMLEVLKTKEKRFEADKERLISEWLDIGRVDGIQQGREEAKAVANTTLSTLQVQIDQHVSEIQAIRDQIEVLQSTSQKFERDMTSMIASLTTEEEELSEVYKGKIGFHGEEFARLSADLQNSLSEMERVKKIFERESKKLHDEATATSQQNAEMMKERVKEIMSSVFFQFRRTLKDQIGKEPLTEATLSLMDVVKNQTMPLLKGDLLDELPPPEDSDEDEDDDDSEEDSSAASQAPQSIPPPVTGFREIEVPTSDFHVLPSHECLAPPPTPSNSLYLDGHVEEVQEITSSEGANRSFPHNPPPTPASVAHGSAKPWGHPADHDSTSEPMREEEEEAKLSLEKIPEPIDNKDSETAQEDEEGCQAPPPTPCTAAPPPGGKRHVFDEDDDDPPFQPVQLPEPAQSLSEAVTNAFKAGATKRNVFDEDDEDEPTASNASIASLGATAAGSPSAATAEEVAGDATPATVEEVKPVTVEDEKPLTPAIVEDAKPLTPAIVEDAKPLTPEIVEDAKPVVGEDAKSVTIEEETGHH